MAAHVVALRITPGLAAPDAPLFLVLALTAVMFEHFQLYRPWRGKGLEQEVLQLSNAWATVLVVAAAAGLLMEFDLADELGRQWLILWALFGCGLLILSRYVLRNLLGWVRARGFNIRRVAVLGLSKVGVAAAEQVNGLPWTGYRIVGYLDDRVVPRVDSAGLQRLGSLEHINALVEIGDLDEVWIAFPFRGEARVKDALHQLRHCSVTTRFLIDVYAFEMMQHSASEIAGVPVMNIHASPLDETLNRWIKMVEDRLLATIILVLLSPLMLLIAAGVKLSSPGPVLYRQQRIGWNNRPFTMLKFRSMPLDAEAASGPVWATKGEHRATSLGSLLRRTSLDELPQFINVLKGDMSIVGPRPERPHFVESFKEEIPLYMKKHMVKAGITGWAQVNGWRGETDLGRRIEFDLYYIQNWSVWLDMKIFYQTIVSGFINKNAY